MSTAVDPICRSPPMLVGIDKEVPRPGDPLWEAFYWGRGLCQIRDTKSDETESKQKDLNLHFPLDPSACVGVSCEAPLFSLLITFFCFDSC